MTSVDDMVEVSGFYFSGQNKFSVEQIKNILKCMKNILVYHLGWSNYQ